MHAVGDAAEVLAASDIGPALAGRFEPVRETTAIVASENPLSETAARPAGPPSPFTCPECSGPLWQLEEGELVRYRCRVGHSYTEDAMVVEQGSVVEAALRSALEALEERAEFLRGMAVRHRERRPQLHDRFTGAADDALERAELIRRALGAVGARPHALDPHAEVVE
jgi:two-component system chemotaxis response regulator CheB